DAKPKEINTPAAAIRAGIGMLHQDPLDFPTLSVLDNFMIGREEGKDKTSSIVLPKKLAAKELKILVSDFNFSLDVNEILGNLTVGERQQLEILRLLSLGVSTLIFDEPTTGISASQKDALFAAMRKLAESGKALIFVSHKLEDVGVLCDRVTVMRQGKVVGEAEIPCPENRLVEMMFGRKLATPNKPKTASNEVALQLDNIIVKNERLTLQIDKLNVQSGEVIGLAGLEGSGQKLLLLMCAGLLPPRSGNMMINGQDMTKETYQNYLKAGVGFLPADRQKEGLVNGLTIQDHVALRQSLGKRAFVNWKETLTVTKDKINLFNIRGKADSKVEKLSGGNQQRTQLALLPIPLNLLLMEHPTRGLDIESTIWVWQQLIARCQTGTTILFTSSDLDEIVQYSDRILVFSGGNVSAPIDTKELTVNKLGQMIGGKFED
ncbi:MAG: ATP-binding cassette domain-containing protein, partial [Phormidium sp.]